MDYMINFIKEWHPLSNSSKVKYSHNSQIFNCIVLKNFFDINVSSFNKDFNNLLYTKEDHALNLLRKKMKYQRTSGYAFIKLNKKKKKKSLVSILRQQGALKVRQPNTHDSLLELVIINTAGGLTGGDLIMIDIFLESYVKASITTQALEKIYNCKDYFANMFTNIIVKSNASLSWMPMETIIFNKSRFRRRLNVELEKNSSFLSVESVVFGRIEMNEVLQLASFNDALQIHKNGKLIYSDFNKIEGNLSKIFNKSLVMKGKKILCNLIYIGENTAYYLKKFKKLLNTTHIFGGVSLVNGIILVKIVANNIIELRRLITQMITLFENKFKMPLIWSC